MSTRPTPALAYNLYLKHDLRRVARAFAEADIPWLLLKGFGLAEAAYGGAAARAMVDNDIVVSSSQAVRAHQVLRGLGFYDRPGNVLELNRAADFQHPMHYPHPDVETGLELHWHIYAPELFRGGFAPFFKRALKREVAGMQVLTLSNEDRLLQLATHWVQHGLSEPRILTDIERLWNRQHESTHKIQVGALVRRLREVGAHAAFALALLVLERQQRLVTPVSQPLRSRRAELFSKALRTLLLRAVEPGDLALRQSEQHQLRIAAWSLLTPGRVLASAWRELLPSAARLSRIAGRKLSKSEVPVYFARRQLGGIRKLWGA